MTRPDIEPGTLPLPPLLSLIASTTTVFIHSTTAPGYQTTIFFLSVSWFQFPFECKEHLGRWFPQCQVFAAPLGIVSRGDYKALCQYDYGKNRTTIDFWLVNFVLYSLIYTPNCETLNVIFFFNFNILTDVVEFYSSAKDVYKLMTQSNFIQD